MYRNELNSLEIDLHLCRKYVAGLPDHNPKMLAFLDAALVQCYRVNHKTLDDTYLNVLKNTEGVRKAIHEHSLAVVNNGMPGTEPVII